MCIFLFILFLGPGSATRWRNARFNLHLVKGNRDSYFRSRLHGHQSGDRSILEEKLLDGKSVLRELATVSEAVHSALTLRPIRRHIPHFDQLKELRLRHAHQHP